MGLVVGQVVPIPNPWDRQCLPGKVWRGGVDLLWLEVVVVEDGDGEIPLDLSKSSFSIPWVPES